MRAPLREGPIQAKIAFISDVPFTPEIMAKRPLVGPAGCAFNKFISQAGIQRQACYIDTIFQETPAGNNPVNFANIFSTNVTTTELWDQRVEELRLRLEEIEANVIVPLGDFALYALTGLTKCNKRRGSILPSTLLPGRKVIPTLDPITYVNHSMELKGKPKMIYGQYLNQYLIVLDLIRVKKESEFPEINLMPRNLILSPGFNDAMTWMAGVKEDDLLAFDIEVKFGEVSHLSFATKAEEAICIPFVDGTKDWWAPDQERDIWLEIARLLEDERITKIGQNVIFDATFLYRKYGIHARPLEDTMIAHAILYPDFPKGLDFITTSYCEGEPYYKDEGKEWFKNPFASEEAFRRYSAMDSAVLAEAFPKIIKDLERQGNLPAYGRQKRLIHPLVYIGEKGIRMDVAGMRAASGSADARIRALQERLNDLCGHEMNANSPQQVKNYFYIEKGLKPYLEKGSITTNDKAMKRIAAKGYEEASIILEMRHERKMKGTYFDIVLEEDNRLRCSFNPVGTVQGRISSSKTIFRTGGNLQNQPPEMLKYMLADEGYIAIAIDLGQAENRNVAYMADEKAMIYAFEHDIDIHNQTAAMILDKKVEDVTRDERNNIGKPTNHGLNYDFGYKSFAILHQMPEATAKILVDKYHQIYPGVRQWHAAVREELSKKRTLTNAFGRKRTFMDRWGDKLFKEAYSYQPQSTIAEKVNIDGYVYVYERQDLFPEVELLNTIHDSIKFQVPLSAGIPRILEIIEASTLKLESPILWKDKMFSIPADVHIGFNLSEEEGISWKSKYIHETPASQLRKEIQEYVESASS